MIGFSSLFMSTETQEINQYVELAQQGDQEAFAWLYEHFSPLIHGYLARRLPVGEAEDLVADVFVKVIERLNTYAPRPEASFKAWLFRVAHHTMVDYFRRLPQHLVPLPVDEDNNELDIPDTNPTPLERLAQTQQRQLLQQLINQLSDKQKAVVQLRFWDDFSIAETAQILNITQVNVRILQWRAFKQLQTLLPSLENTEKKEEDGSSGY